MENPPSGLTQELAKLDWKHFDPYAGLRCLPAMALILAVGLFVHQPAAGVIAAGGAFSVGLSSFRQLQGSRLLQMSLTSLGMGCGASLGTLAGHSPVIVALAAGLLGLLYGLVLVFSENASWIGLQSVIAFLVAGAFPAYGWHAIIRGSLVTAGGITQALVTVLILLVSLRSNFLSQDMIRCRPDSIWQVCQRDVWPTILRQVDHRLPVMRYAVRLSLTLMLAVTLSRGLHQLNAYWLPMTTLLVMKPDFYRTYTSSVGRVLGTFLGVLLASLLTHMLHPSPLLLLGLVLCFAWLCFSWQKVNYTIFTCALTSWIVFLISITGLPEATVTANRLLDTALGCLIALASRALGPRWENVAVTPASARP